MSGLEGVWKACGGVKMGCIMTPMPNHLSTLKPHKTVWKTHSTQLKNHTKQCGKEERSGVGMEQMRRMDEMVCG